MSLTTNEVTAIGWIVVPIITAFLTYYQQKKSQSNINAQAIIREKEERFEKILDHLENDAKEFWIGSGDSKKTTRLSINIKHTLKKLEKELPEKHLAELIRLRQEVSGDEFENPEREGLPPTHERFHNISAQIENIRNIKNS